MSRETNIILFSPNGAATYQPRASPWIQPPPMFSSPEGATLPRAHEP